MSNNIVNWKLLRNYIQTLHLYKMVFGTLYFLKNKGQALFDIQNTTAITLEQRMIKKKSVSLVTKQYLCNQQFLTHYSDLR